MKLGFVRHFKVNVNEPPEKLDWKEYKRIMEEYDVLDVTPTEVDLREINWNKCYSSDLPRAKTTAEAIYKSEIIESQLIREVDLRIVRAVDGYKLMKAWSIYSLMSWAREREVIAETMTESNQRVNEFLDLLEANTSNDDNVLVVCHGMIMSVFQDELIKRGYTGEEMLTPDNGELFLYEKEI